MSAGGAPKAAESMFTSSGGTAENDLARVHRWAFNAWEVVKR